MRYHGSIGGQISLQQKTPQRHWNDGLNIYIYIYYNIHIYILHIYIHIFFMIYTWESILEWANVPRFSDKAIKIVHDFWLTRLTLCISIRVAVYLGIYIEIDTHIYHTYTVDIYI